MLKPLLLFTTLIVSSCAFKLWDDKNTVKNRHIASEVVQELTKHEEQSFELEVEEKLNSLHSYQVIAQKYLFRFDQESETKGLAELYRSHSYLGLIAARTQIDEIESDLEELWTILNQDPSPASTQRKKIISDKARALRKISGVHAASLDNLLARLKISPKHSHDSTKRELFHENELETEYERMQTSKEFQIYEKNVEHTSHLLEIKLKSQVQKFRPSINDSGNITGNEFPAKVWALTFNDGPHELHTQKILEILKQKKLKATFFQLSKKTLSQSQMAKRILASEMEIASHSESHRDLNLVGELTLHQEIALATQSMEKALKLDIKFFRLPYGIGISTPHIREKIANEELIHVIYNIDSLDWISQHPSRIIARVKALMKKTRRDSGILLFHDTHKRGVIASQAIMEYLKQDGRRACSIGEIVTQMNEGAKTVCPKY